ncbi:MAG: GspE/PulE family protein [bacterium]
MKEETLLSLLMEQSARVDESDEMLLLSERSPVAQYVNAVLKRAVQAQASDIHFEPFEKELKIRYRVDGALCEMPSPPLSLASPVVSRLKVMANLNIAEKRAPQDGRIRMSLAGREVDLRISTLPIQHGESIVLRVLDRDVAARLKLENLGMSEEIYQRVVRVTRQPSGVFIVTGPTGAGKTTTLYGCLNRINASGVKVLTVEEPVEYELEGVQQVPVQEAIGLTFSRVLRSFLRHDPDCILIGETRDPETARIAIQASLTGHLVLTSLHTGDASGAVARLLDMGVEPFLVSASLAGVLAQRLLRKICVSCRIEHRIDPALLRQNGVEEKNVFYRGKGCEECRQGGYDGRCGIFEWMEVGEPIRELINRRAASFLIRQKAVESGMTTLRDEALRKAREGVTTFEEALARV